MREYAVELSSKASETFRCQCAANSLDIDIEKKLTHTLKIECDLETDFNVALIVGASGSGKTTLAQTMFGDDCFQQVLDSSKPVIDQFPDAMTYDECANLLNAVGLSSVVCWIRPAHTLSNGQKCRAECALQMARGRDLIVIDEWTSVVDRTIAKVMSHAIQKFARKRNKKIILISCHYDVIEWVNPDFVIDCNTQSYTDRRSERREFERQEKLEFEIRETSRQSWRYFSKYHYLSDRLPGGHIEIFGLFEDEKQIGFQCFANYVPCRPGQIKKMHSNRTVIHPDYVGLGLGIKLINETSSIMKKRGFDVMAKFSSAPIYRAMKNSSKWILLEAQGNFKGAGFGAGDNMNRHGGFRKNVKTYSFRFVG